MDGTLQATMVGTAWYDAEQRKLRLEQIVISQAKAILQHSIYP